MTKYDKPRGEARMKRIKTLILAATIAVTLTLAPAIKAEDVDLKKPDYKPLSNLVGQADRNYPTQDGMWPCVELSYDRNEDGKKDLVEVRRMNEKGDWWEANPYIIITDDDFDGYSDRILVDIERDGKFDKGQDIKSKKIPIEEY